MSDRAGGIADVKALLTARVDALVAHCAPGGRRENGYWIARNPTRDDRHAGSFWVILQRPGMTPGAWRDEATGERGDVIDLICYTQRLDRKGALAWAKDWLNYKALPATAIAQARKTQEETNRRADEIAARKLAENQASAGRLYRQSKLAPFRGSTADLYLASRGIDLGLLSRVPGSLGALPRMRHTETDTMWPVMVAGMQAPDGRMLAVHRTFLAIDGSGKAPVEPARKIWPSFKGLAIRLWRGASDMAIMDALKHGVVDTLALVEGVEDGLSVALARPDLRIWAAGSLGNLREIEIPPNCSTVVVCADNDWGKPQAEKQLGEALRAIARQGVTVKVARSPIGKDMNDCLRGAA